MGGAEIKRAKQIPRTTRGRLVASAHKGKSSGRPRWGAGEIRIKPGPIQGRTRTYRQVAEGDLNLSAEGRTREAPMFTASNAVR